MSESIPARMRVTTAAVSKAILDRQAVQTIRLEDAAGVAVDPTAGAQIPKATGVAGVYVLKATVAAGGAVTYAWVADTP